MIGIVNNQTGFPTVTPVVFTSNVLIELIKLCRTPLSEKYNETLIRAVSNEGGGGGAVRFAPSEFLTDQITLPQPGGGNIISTQYYKPPWIFRPCDSPVDRFISNFRE